MASRQFGDDWLQLVQSTAACTLALLLVFKGRCAYILMVPSAAILGLCQNRQKVSSPRSK